MALAAAVSTCFLLLSEWEEEPTVTTVEEAAKPISQLEYPAVVVCPSGLVDLDAKMARFGDITYASRGDESIRYKFCTTQIFVSLFFPFIFSLSRRLQEKIPDWPDNLSLEDFVVHMHAENFVTLATDAAVGRRNAGKDHVLHELLEKSEKDGERRDRNYNIWRRKKRLIDQSNVRLQKTETRKWRLCSLFFFFSSRTLRRTTTCCWTSCTPASEAATRWSSGALGTGRRSTASCCSTSSLHLKEKCAVKKTGDFFFF